MFVFTDDFQQKFVDEVFYGLIKMLQHVKVSAYCRDAAMELMIKTVSRKTGYHWTPKFLDCNGEYRLGMDRVHCSSKRTGILTTVKPVLNSQLRGAKKMAA